MRIYKINIEHKISGRNWDSTKVAADNFAVAIKKVHLNKNEMIESVELLASTN